jgi:quinol monooxygenase YgiN
MPVVATAYFRPAPAQHDRVIEALRPAIAAVHQEPGCELYAIHDASDGTIVVIEKWTSVQELDDHGAGKAVRELNASLEGLLASPARSHGWCHYPPEPKRRVSSDGRSRWRECPGYMPGSCRSP